MRPTLPTRATDAHKEDFGRILMIGGSRGMSGAISLAAMAALRTGAGIVSAAIPDRCLETVAGFSPSLMTVPLADRADGSFAAEAVNQLPDRVPRYSAIGCGPGMRTGPGATKIVGWLIKNCTQPLVLDADAMNILSQSGWIDQDTNCRQLVLTPHAGEFERLTGIGAEQRDKQATYAQALATKRGCIIVLKGGPTLVFGPDHTYENTTGNPGMATAGSGDVLTGVITSLLGQGLGPSKAAQLGVWIHGKAGDNAALSFGQAGMTAVDILNELPSAVRLLATAPEAAE